MKNRTKNYDEEELMKNEPPVEANDLLAEIQPLLSDYFHGDISFDGHRIAYNLPNGQKFVIQAEEFARSSV